MGPFYADSLDSGDLDFDAGSLDWPDDAGADLGAVASTAAPLVLAAIPGGQAVAGAYMVGKALGVDKLVGGIGSAIGGLFGGGDSEFAKERVKMAPVYFAKFKAMMDDPSASVTEITKYAQWISDIGYSPDGYIFKVLEGFKRGLAGSSDPRARQLATAPAAGPALRAAPMTQIDPLATRPRPAAVSLVSPQVRTAAAALLSRPDLRGIPLSQAARQIATDTNTIRQAAASIVQSVQRTGSPATAAISATIAPAAHLENLINVSASLDQALARLASRGAPAQYSPRPTARTVARARAPQRRPTRGARGFSDAGAMSDPHATIRQGSTGADVKEWQAFLGFPADGQFGPQTLAATRAWQAARGLPADGVVGPATWARAAAVSAAAAAAAAMGSTVPAATAATAAAPAAIGHATIRQGSTGPAVKEWQAFIGAPVDGQFGPQTAAATRAWQAAHGLASDGVVGPLTWGRAAGSSAAATAAAQPAAVLVAAAAPVATGPAAAAIESGKQVRFYVVRAGDNMSRIAQKFTGAANRWRELARANPKIKNPDLLFAGDSLALPAGWPSLPAAAGASAPVAAPAAQAAPAAAVPLAVPANVAADVAPVAPLNVTRAAATDGGGGGVGFVAMLGAAAALLS